VDLLNLSALGVFMELPAALRPGSTCDLSAMLAGIPLTALVRITRCRAGGIAADDTGGRAILYQAAGEFVGLSDEQRAGLARAIAKIGGAKLGSQSAASLKRVRPA
jgi:hypothetical protein